VKFRITMKDPDGAYESIQDAATERADQIAKNTPLVHGEREALFDSSVNYLREAASKWMEYGEYLTVEIDTEAMTCVVVAK
jgi:hypothetical protein